MPQCIMINLIEDFIIEGNQSFSVEISDFGGANMGSPTSATITIIDNDGKYVTLSLCFKKRDPIHHI